MRAVIYSFLVSSLSSLIIVVFAFGCAGRSESMVYTPDTLPSWIVKEWQKAQDELLKLPDLKGDPRSISPYQFSWVQLQQPFYHYDEDILLFGSYDHTGGKREIIICCGRKETVRHEASHAILHVLGDSRYDIHYPQLKEMME